MKSIILDLDGTLLDSCYRHQKLLYDLLLKRISHVEWKDMDNFLIYKRDGYSTLQYLKKNYTNLDFKNIADEWVSLIEDPYYLKFDKVYSDTYEFLKLIQKKYYLILLTARKNQFLLIKQLKDFALKEYFNDIQVVSPFEKKLLQNPTKIEQIIAVIGDTEKDRETAEYYKCEFYALNRGFRNKKFWDSMNITSYSSLFNILTKL